MSMTLLLVDDNAKVREMVRKLFHNDADPIYECDDGAQAFDSYKVHRPDWVLMDIKMKELDGVAATKAITATYPDAKIIIVTQFDDPVLRQEALAAGAIEYVLKENMHRLPDIMKAIT